MSSTPYVVTARAVLITEENSKNEDVVIDKPAGKYNVLFLINFVIRACSVRYRGNETIIINFIISSHQRL